MEGVYFHSKQCAKDERGWLIELYRHDELESIHCPLMAYVSETLAGVMRGPHEHTKQTDHFLFIGPGDFELYLWDRRSKMSFDPNNPEETHIVGESNPVGVIVPPGVVHAYKNISKIPGWVFNAPNQLYRGPGKKYPPDEIRYEHD